MTDVLFACPECSKHLVVDDEAVGKRISCPDCGNGIRVPEAGILFFCPSCKATLSAPDALSCLLYTSPTPRD